MLDDMLLYVAVLGIWCMGGCCVWVGVVYGWVSGVWVGVMIQHIHNVLNTYITYRHKALAYSVDILYWLKYFHRACTTIDTHSVTHIYHLTTTTYMISQHLIMHLQS